MPILSVIQQREITSTVSQTFNVILLSLLLLSLVLVARVTPPSRRVVDVVPASTVAASTTTTSSVTCGGGRGAGQGAVIVVQGRVYAGSRLNCAVLIKLSISYDIYIYIISILYCILYIVYKIFSIDL